MRTNKSNKGKRTRREPTIWCCVSCLISISVAGVATDWEEKTLLLTVTDDESIEAKAKRIAKQDDSTYLNKYGETVEWRFEEILEVYLLDSRLKDGIEVMSRLLGKTQMKILRARRERALRIMSQPAL